MKHLALPVAAILALSACETPMPASDTEGRILTEAEFREAVAGRTATAGNTTLVVNADGTIAGTAPQGAVSGRWNWQQGYFCRTASIGGTALGSDCQTVVLVGDVLTYTRDQGRGEATTYTLG